MEGRLGDVIESILTGLIEAGEEGGEPDGEREEQENDRIETARPPRLGEQPGNEGLDSRDQAKRILRHLCRLALACRVLFDRCRYLYGESGPRIGPQRQRIICV